jgi:hypothetical protein
MAAKLVRKRKTLSSISLVTSF